MNLLFSYETNNVQVFAAHMWRERRVGRGTFSKGAVGAKGQMSQWSVCWYAGFLWISTFSALIVSWVTFHWLTQVCQTEGDRRQLLDRSIEKSLVRHPRFCNSTNTTSSRSSQFHLQMTLHTSFWVTRCSPLLCNKLHIVLCVKIYLCTYVTRM